MREGLAATRGLRAAFLLLACGIGAAPSSHAIDCNGNGVEDQLDLADGGSADCDGNHVPDECDAALPELGFAVTARGDLRARVEHVLIADLDGARGPDVVVVEKLSDALAVLLSRGNGRFAEPLAVPVGSLPVAAAAADVDGDGDLDLAAANSGSGDLSLIRNEGGGRFRARASVATGGSPASVLAADLDGDGDPDLVVPSPSTGSIALLRNLGDGSFEAATVLDALEELGPVDIADWDGDGDLDLLAATGTVMSVVLADGAFGFGERLETPIPGALDEMRALDLDGDGDADLIGASSRLYALEVLINEGPQEWTPRTFEVTPHDIVRLAVADFDGDGDADVIASGRTRHDELIALAGDGAGNFRQVWRLTDPAAWCSCAPFRAQSLAVGDLDGDGRPDVAAAEGVSVWILSNEPMPPNDCDRDGIPDGCDAGITDCNANGRDDSCELATGTAQDCNANGVPDRCDVESGESADCNGNHVPDECDLAGGTSPDRDADGIPDECERDCDGDGVIDLLELAAGSAEDCNGDGSPDDCELAPAPSWPEPSLLVPRRIARRDLAAADIDGDGDTDLLVAVAFGIEIIENRGGRSFELIDLIPVGSNPQSVVPADLDGDGDVDLATRNRVSSGFPDNISLLINEGGGRFTPRANLGFGAPIEDVLVEDFNGDGAIDLAVVQEGSPVVRLLFNAGGAAFGEPVAVQFDGRTDDVIASDLDGDGDRDLAAAIFALAGVQALFNDGRGGFAAGRRIETPDAPLLLAAGDLDGDGDADLAFTGGGSRFSRRLGVLANRGDGSFEPQSASLPAPFGPYGFLAITDLDADGWSDVVAVESGSGRVFENRGDGSLLLPRSLPLAGGSSALVGDLDGDGLPDLAFIRGQEIEVSFGSVLPSSPDCNGNGIPDACDLAGGASGDCDLNGVPDECDVAVADCNGNGVPDACDLLPGLAFNETGRLELGEYVAAVAAGDIGGDGRPDLVVLRRGDQSTLSTFVGTGDGAFAEPTHVTFDAGGRFLSLDDLDGDGDLDAIVAMNPGLFLFHNSAGRGFTEPLFVEVGEQSRFFAVADLDGDRRPDVAVDSGIGTAILFNRGGALDGPIPVLGSDGCTQGMVAGDLDGDGDTDIVKGTTACAIAPEGLMVLRNRGDGSFDVELSILNADFYSPLALADIDGDGLPDVLFRDGFFGNPGDDRFAVPGRFPQGIEFRAATDVDTDGDLDVLLGQRFSPGLFVRLQRSDGQLDVLRSLATPGPFSVVTPIDIDGDGDQDLAAVPESREAVVVFRNDTTPAASVDLNRDRLPDECEPSPRFHRGDADGDGRVAISDAIRILGHLFLGGHAPPCADAADVDDGGGIDVTDAIGLLGYLFLGGPPPAPPGPPPLPCGVDPRDDGPDGDLGCELYERC